MVTQGSTLWFYVFPIVIILLALAGYRKLGRGRFILLILLFFSLFRGDNVGNDTKNYLDPNHVQYAASVISGDVEVERGVDSIGSKTEITSLVINWIVYNLSLSPRFVIYAYSLIFLLFAYLSLKRLRINTSLGQMFLVLSTLYFFSLTAARQMAAVGLFSYGITYLFEDGKRSWRFFIITLLAATIHTSAIFFIWLYALRYVKVSRLLLLIIAAIVCIFVILIDFNILNVVYKVLNVEYILRYMGLFDESERSLLGRLFDLLRYGFFLLIFLKRNKSKSADLYDVIFFTGLILMALFSHASLLIGRVTYYLTIFVCFYLAKVLAEDNRLRDRTISSYFALYCFLVLYTMGFWSEALTSGYYLMF